MAENFPKSLDGWAAYLTRQPIPVMRHTAEHIERLREQLDDIDARVVADRVGSDPLMVLRTFAQIAERRGNRRAADVATLDRAIVMLGLTPFLDIARDAPVVEASPSAERGAYRGFLRVLRRAQMARIYATRIAAWRNDVAAEEIGLAALLHDSAELLVWCFAPELAERIRHMLTEDPKLRSATAQREVLGTTINALQLRLAKLWSLPELLVRLMDDRQSSAPRIRNAIVAVNIARHSATGWENPALPDDYRELASLLQITDGKARALIHQEAEATR